MSREWVFQLEDEPIKEEDKLNLNTVEYDEWFMHSVADWLEEEEEGEEYTNEDIVHALLTELGAAATYNEEENSITIVHRDIFFKTNYEKFKELSENVTFEQFKDWYWVYNVKDCIAPLFCTYIYNNSTLTNIHDFMRDNCKDGDKFYIGGAVQYHC